MDTRCWFAICMAVVVMRAEAAGKDVGKFSRVSEVPDLGMVTTVYEANDENCNFQLYLEIDPDMLYKLNCSEHHCPTVFCPIELPAAAVLGTPFNHICIAYNPHGHEPWDGQNGGFGVANFNVYFNTAPYEELALRTCDGLPRCDPDHPSNDAFFQLPPTECIPFDYSSPEYFGSHAIEYFGNHLISNATFEYFTPYDIDLEYSIEFVTNTTTELIPQVSSNDRPLWVDCQIQATQKVMGIDPQLDSGCRVPRWVEVATPAYNFYHEALVGAVIIISQPSLSSSCQVHQDLSQPSSEWAWDSYFTTFGPVAYFVESHHHKLRIGYDLNNIGANIPCMHHNPPHKKSATLSVSRGYMFVGMPNGGIDETIVLLTVLVSSFIGVIWLTKRIYYEKHQHSNRYDL